MSKCDTCANYTTYLRLRNNGYMNVINPISLCDLGLNPNECGKYTERLMEK